MVPISTSQTHFQATSHTPLKTHSQCQPRFVVNGKCCLQDRCVFVAPVNPHTAIHHHQITWYRVDGVTSLQLRHKL